MKVPFWVIRNIVYPYGARQPQMPVRAREATHWEKTRGRYDTDDRCPLCKLPYGSSAKILRNGIWICTWCNRSTPQKFTPMGFVKVTTAFNPKPGNLKNWEYRFWIGVAQEYGTFSVCRACRTVCHGGAERFLHKHDSKKSWWNCNVLLVNTYKELLEKGKCVVCKDYTKKQKWGVPLCGGSCQERWKFDMDRWLPLEMTLHQVRHSTLFNSSGLNDTESTSSQGQCTD